MTYDVHAHCVPRELIELLRVDGDRFDMAVESDERGDTVVIAGQFGVGPLPAGLADRESRLRAMDDAGVDVQLISHRTDLSAYMIRADAGRRFARAFNTIMAEEVARAPDRLLGLGTVPLQDPEGAAEELWFAVRELGMVGVEIASTVDGMPLDVAKLEPFWEAAAELRCFVLLHPNQPLRGVDLSSYFLDNLVGRPAESTIAIGRLLFSGVFDRHPNLVLCLVHGGGFLPYQLGRWQKGYSVVPHLTAANIGRPPLEIARQLYYDSLVHIPEAVSFLVDVVGADHVVMGSDYPYEMHERQPVRAVEAVPGLSDADRSLILGSNVERIMSGIRR